jgi:hypothetical protein
LVFNASYIKRRKGGEFIDGRRRTLLGWFATLFPLLSPLLAAKPAVYKLFSTVNVDHVRVILW